MTEPQNNEMAWVEVTLLLSPHDTFKAILVGDFDLADYTNNATTLTISDNPELYAEISAAAAHGLHVLISNIEITQQPIPDSDK